VLPPNEGAKGNCIVAKGPQTIPLRGIRAERLAFLHTMRQSQPRFAPRPVGEYEVIYASGERRSIQLLENYNITDVRSGAGVRTHPWNFAASPDVLLGSVLGWRGPSLSGMPMNLQVMVWENPRPDERIERVVVKPISGAMVVVVGLSAVGVKP
jgi:hypothetical protein